MNIIEIKNRWSGAVIYSGPHDSVTSAVVAAIVAKSDLRGANLRGANLTGANLRGANLTDAKNAKLAIAKTRILPQGEIVGWKKCREGVIVRLTIPREAKRSHAFGRKCRAEFAIVEEVIGAEFAVSSHNSTFQYRKGETVRPLNGFYENWQEECAAGIHFFITREEAEAY